MSLVENYFGGPPLLIATLLLSYNGIPGGLGRAAILMSCCVLRGHCHQHECQNLESPDVPSLPATQLRTEQYSVQRARRYPLAVSRTAGTDVAESQHMDLLYY